MSHVLWQGSEKKRKGALGRATIRKGQPTAKLAGERYVPQTNERVLTGPWAQWAHKSQQTVWSRTPPLLTSEALSTRGQAG